MSTTTIRDTFNRAVVDGWGATDTGHPWQTSGGAAMDRQVSGGAGRVTLHAAPGAIRSQRIGRPATDGEIVTQVVAGQVSETTA
ncbi:hypothetical protein [Nocardiopsis sp. YSL2]|uniref:hypothetical protein n=1 Tax=Nocardiopsis sp. YSL2 TaxID=2939492 RepID=UPI0026F47801|nr:hypothetical protein [Nocardiopsis sp. YSL2]